MGSGEQAIEILKARTKAFRFVKGQSGNPDGQSRFYHQGRKIAREASPDMRRELIELERNAASRASSSWPNCLFDKLLNARGVPPASRIALTQSRGDRCGLKPAEVEYLTYFRDQEAEDRSSVRIQMRVGRPISPLWLCPPSRPHLTKVQWLLGSLYRSRNR